MSVSRRFRRSLFALLALLVLGLTTGQPALAQGSNKNRGIVPPNARYKGLTYGEWQVRWWQDILALPVINGVHPFLTFGAYGGKDGVVFLCPSYGIAGSYTVDVTIPAGTPLFFPVRMNVEWSVLELPPFPGDVEAYLRQFSNDWLDANASDWAASVDGKPVQNIDAYRTESPLFEFGPLPENNLFQFFGLGDGTVGATSLSVAVGHYLMLTPLSIGQHEVRVSAIAYDLNPAGDWSETVFRINVVSKRK